MLTAAPAPGLLPTVCCPAVQDPYRHEPSRHPALLVRSSKPFNGETPPELLTAAPITPVDVFYVRHHLPVPQVAADTYSLKVHGAWQQERIESVCLSSSCLRV